MILGIDPGVTGGLAVISGRDIWLEPMPRTEEGGLDVRELARLVGDFAKDLNRAYVEQIFAMQKASAHSMMVLGQTRGAVLGVLAAYRIPVVEVRAQEWMKAMHKGCPSNLKTKERSEWVFRNRYAHLCANEPGSKRLHMGMVEAALIAEYGRQVST